LMWRHNLQIVVIGPGIPEPSGMLVFGWIVDSVECPAFFVPVLMRMRETGQRGAEHGEGQEAYT
jgi:hypothetical protein